MGTDDTPHTQAGHTPATLTMPANSDLLKAKLRLGTNRLMKAVLCVLEDYVAAHDTALKKLYDALPPEYRTYVELADYVTDEGIEATRKSVLRVGNDMVRDCEGVIDLIERLGGQS